MWLPAPIYESLPYLYLFGGILFVSGTFYIGFSSPGAMLYISCGIVSIIYGAYISKRRSDARRGASQSANPESV